MGQRVADGRDSIPSCSADLHAELRSHLAEIAADSGTTLDALAELARRQYPHLSDEDAIGLYACDAYLSRLSPELRSQVQTRHRRVYRRVQYN